MKTPTEVRRFRVGTMKIEIHPTREAAGQAAALAAQEILRELGTLRASFGVIFATGASQLAMLDSLTAMTGCPWNQVEGFHLDEYVGIAPDHPASFRRYLREQLTEKVPLRAFHDIDGSYPDPEYVCASYAEKLTAANPQLCLLGIGENGHLAFNDPAVADFHDPLRVKVVALDAVSRRQQVAEGWFKTFEDTPEQAITVTMPAIYQVPRLIVSVPGKRKAKIMRRTIEDVISTNCPSTILRTHPNATVYLDPESSAELDGVLS